MTPLDRTEKQDAELKTTAKSTVVSRVELAEELGVSLVTIDRRTRDGTFPSFRAGRRRLYSLDRVLEALTAKGAEEKPLEMDGSQG